MSNIDSSDLPPPRTKKAPKPVSPPLSSTRLHRFIYVLAILTTLLAAYYSWRITQWKTDIGGWRSLAFGRQGSSSTKTNTRSADTVESRINALAEALGMPPKNLASAIAVAVREHVPPASLSSVAARETGPVVDILVGEKREAKAADPGVMGGVVSGVETFVGMDEP